jgi:hypothetical protein
MTEPRIITASMLSAFSKCGFLGFMKYFADESFFENISQDDLYSSQGAEWRGTGIKKKYEVEIKFLIGNYQHKGYERWIGEVTNEEGLLDKSKFGDIGAIANAAIKEVNEESIKEGAIVDPKEVSFWADRFRASFGVSLKKLEDFIVINKITKIKSEVQYLIKAPFSLARGIADREDSLDEYAFSGKIDIVMEDEFGQISFMDIKTVSEKPSEEGMRDDLQFRKYSFALSLRAFWDKESSSDISSFKLGKKGYVDEVETVGHAYRLYLEKPKIRQKKNESFQDYNERWSEQVKDRIGIQPIIYDTNDLLGLISQAYYFVKRQQYSSLNQKTSYPLLCVICSFKDICNNFANSMYVKNEVRCNYEYKITRHSELSARKERKEEAMNITEFIDSRPKVPKGFKSRIEVLVFLVHDISNKYIDKERKDGYAYAHKEFKEGVKNGTLPSDLMVRLLASGDGTIDGYSTYEETINEVKRQYNDFIVELNNLLANPNENKERVAELLSFLTNKAVKEEPVVVQYKEDSVVVPVEEKVVKEEPPKKKATKSREKAAPVEEENDPWGDAF